MAEIRKTEKPVIKPVENIVLAAGSTKQRALPRAVLRGLKCRLNTNVTNGSSGVSNSALETMKFIDFVKLTVNGSNDVINADGEYYYFKNFIHKQGILTQSITNTTSSTQNNNVHFDIPFTMPGIINPEDCLLLANNLSSEPILDIKFASSLGTNVTFNSGTLEIFPDVYIDWDGLKETTNNQSMTSKVSRVKEEYTTTGAGKLLKPPIGPIYKSFLLVAKNSSGVNSNSIISNIKVKADSTEYVNLPAYMVQAWNSELFGYAQSVQPAGLYYIDLIRMGRINQALDTGKTSRISEFSLEFTADAAGSVTCYSEIFAPAL